MRGITLFAILMFAYFSGEIKAQVTIGSGMVPNEGSLLDLKQFNTTTNDLDKDITSLKGLNFPRVSLTDPLRLEPCATTNITNKRAHRGLIVYHTDNTIMDEGLYYWNGNSWRRLVDEIPPTPQIRVHMLDMLEETSSILVTGSDATEDGRPLPFGIFNPATNRYELEINETGSYAFSFRLYGHLRYEGPSSPTGTAVIYINVMVNNQLADVAEIDIPWNVNLPTTYSVTLACTANAGDIITFRWSHNNRNISYNLRANPGTNNAARTSLVYWKL